MKWSNLKLNKCPDCNKTFGFIDFNTKAGYIVCRCGFNIREKRYSEIVSSMINKQIEEQLDEEYLLND